MTLQDDIQALPDEEFRDLKAWIVTTETDRRAAQPAVEQARAEDTQKLWEAHPELKPDFETEPVEVDTGATVTLDDLLASYPAWKQPTGAHDALPTGAIVTHNGDVWRTDLPTLNVWVPEEGNPHTRWVKITDELLAEYNPPEVDDQDTEPETEDTPDEPETEETEETTVPEWKPNIAVTPGQKYTHNGETYEVIQPHTTQDGWKPDALPALYKKL